MKLQIVSDLHLEWGTDIDIANAGADVLVLSGDIQTARELFYNRDASFPFFARHAEKFADVIYVFGNHEHYHGDLDLDYEQIKVALAPLTNIHILDRETERIQGFPFLGCTLWTDCNKNDERTKRVLQEGMNDYHLIHNRGVALTPDDTREIHRQTILWIEDTARTLGGEPCAVIGHHAPSLQSVHPRHKHDPVINGGYSSDLEWLMMANPNIVLWTHGHTHDSFDYLVGKCRIVCNAAGYPLSRTKRENANFGPVKIVTI